MQFPFLRKTLIVAAALGCATTGQAALTLTGTVRDFTPSTNPDFEYAIGNDLAITTSTLGLDGKPVYAPGPGGSTATTHSKTSFDAWYHQPLNEGVTSKTLPITLSDIGGGLFEYSSSSFFPIDGELLGNYAFGHNYHFTFELHTKFTYTGAKTFSFAGDDDVWVYINGAKVIDLGGVHGSQSASISTGTLGLTLGNTYNLDFFFAERHTTGSNFKMTTAIELQPVPEPSTWLAGALCAAGIGFRSFRRKPAAS